MKVKFIKSFEGRMIFYVVVSVMITAIVDLGAFKLLSGISNQLRYMGYRSSFMGPDGLNQTFRIFMLILIGIAVFMSVFYYLLHGYMKYVRIITNGIKDIARGNFDTEIPVETEDEFGQMAEFMGKMQKNIKDILERE